MIQWREKLRAFAIHFAVTLVLAAGAAAIIFGLWFPDPFDRVVGGAGLFVLVVGCDLALGPLISLVIYNSRKSRKELFFDYSIVAAVQLAALAYGVYIVAGSRPVYVAFVKDRLELVSARDIRPAELAAAKEAQYRSLPLTGPRFIYVLVPVKEQSDALFASLDGNEEAARPRFYVSYDSQLESIRARTLPLAELEKKHPEAAPLLAAAIAESGLPATKLGWMPLRYRDNFWTALIDVATGRPAAYVEFDPY
ncbi:MAG TPA: TfpX/TfpZ family type IV pilin accessory protein [Steroidobacteraceae bacterium]|nr:TfpX/TfpZ family type IV pilin accessory protein [Steroidobacteraceae bacterium]